MGASDDPRATAAPVALAADTMGVDMAVTMVARVARVAKEGIIEEETMVAASPPTTVEVVLVPSTLTPIRTAVIMAVVAVVTATARRTDVVAAVAEIVEERIIIMVTDRLTAVVAWEGIITLFNFFPSFSRVQLFIHSFVTCSAQRTTKIHSNSYFKKVRLMN